MLNKCHIASFVIGGLLIAAAIVLLAGNFPEKLINSEINDQLQISMDSPVFDDWVNPPPPIYMQYWVFDVTNPQDVIAGKKPNVTEIGPFTYRLYQPRYNVIFYTNDTVSYQYNHTLVFNKEMSYADPHDIKIRNLNVPLLTVLSMIKNLRLPKFIIDFVLDYFQDTDLFPEHTAYELLFGYPDPIFSKLHTFLPNLVPEKFGLFYGFNNSDDGVYLVDSGRKDISQVNEMRKWNHEEHLDYWSTKYGNMLNGTDGVFFHPNMSENEMIYAFSTDICRSLPFAFEKQSKTAGLKSYRYHTTEMAFANTTVNPNNAAFCTPAGNCMGSGVLNISVCKQNAPVVISSPHFYLGDPKYVNAVNGMHPNKTFHETYLDIEPTTGTVLRAQKRLQLNIQLEPSDVLSQLNNVKITTFPFAWLNESVLIDNGSANHLKSVLSLKKFVLALPYILFAISALLFIAVLVSLCLCRHKSEKASGERTPLLVDAINEGDAGTT